MRRRARIAALPLLALALAAGCSQEPSRHAVTGTVTLDGQPAPYVAVKFIPPSRDSWPGGATRTDTAGKFTIGEVGKNTGLPAGEYKVTFSQTRVKGKPTPAGSGGKAQEKEKTETEAVAEEFRDPEKTKITATVGSGANEFTFDVKSGK
ncbi:hypothetical protein OJF2_57420 [Aquisphaera giovannonii]|uniref:Carboxypeptidase regulatory-like domain-containing protein n=1 Tax=Aquisphaera giovannonii TaxID=406548 RepID=A0A5B9WAM6_9BACT|nr:carboxypeptidase-like regulatory domain-containing protein [Aquisphaera giovannonii]QEH37155.1 hypothetical protein OJF2_57420 [Aquisphaera giovannonii]